MKKITLIFLFAFISTFAFAQQGLENILVEKYYVSDANDSTVNDGISASPDRLPVGSVTWRIYADMLPGYKFQAAFGSPTHELRIETTTAFFNNEDRGATTPTYTKTQAKGNTIMLDSWLSAGAACAGQFGILKTLDNGVSNVVNSDGALQNADASAGIPLTSKDGLIAGSPGQVTFVGLTTEQDVFGDGSVVGNSFITSNGAWSCLNGSKGADTIDNKVLIAQITTDGAFTFKLNIQIGDSAGGTQTYVADNNSGSEILMPALNFNSALYTAVSRAIMPTAALAVYPNPATDIVTIEINSIGRTNSNSYAIYDVDGRLITIKKIESISGKHIEKVDVSSLASGVYFLELSLDGVTSTKKIVKN